jgi:hypothetical protein
MERTAKAGKPPLQRHPAKKIDGMGVRKDLNESSLCVSCHSPQNAPSSVNTVAAENAMQKLRVKW